MNIARSQDQNISKYLSVIKSKILFEEPFIDTVIRNYVWEEDNTLDNFEFTDVAVKYNSDYILNNTLRETVAAFVNAATDYILANKTAPEIIRARRLSSLLTKAISARKEDIFKKNIRHEKYKIDESSYNINEVLINGSTTSNVSEEQMYEMAHLMAENMKKYSFETQTSMFDNYLGFMMKNCSSIHQITVFVKAAMRSVEADMNKLKNVDELFLKCSEYISFSRRSEWKR